MPRPKSDPTYSADLAAAAEALSGSWGYRIQPADVRLRRFHDRVECTVMADRRAILEVALVDPTPITGHDIQYPPGMHLARVADEKGTTPRLIQVDSEYEFQRADRVAVEPVSASFAACDVTITNVRYICNPDIPAAEGTLNVGA